MKSLTSYINESLTIKLGADNMYHPQDKKELESLIGQLIEERGNNADLNDIDTSKITNMNYMFYNSKFNGDISKWNMSNVKYMYGMFQSSKFNGDISQWDVSNVTDMGHLFCYSVFNGDISQWDVSNVKYMSYMFNNSPLEKNPPAWYKG